MTSNKRVFITGASAGFGFETTKALAQNGHTVYATMRSVSGRNAEKAAALARWAQDHQKSIHLIDLDVTRDESVEKAVAAAVNLGGIDVVINNAGVGTWGIDEGFTVDQAQQIFDINVFGVMRVNRAVLPHFRRAQRGLVIYVSSGLGRIILPFLAIYTSSKFALEAYAEGSSYELAPLGVESVILQPGAYGTTFLSNSMHASKDVTAQYGQTADNFKAFGGAFEQRAKSGGLGNPSEVVQALVEEVEREPGDRPLRRTVGHDVIEPVTTINQTCGQVQDHLLTAFGMK